MANAVKAGEAYVKIGVKGGAIFKKQLRKASISIQLFNRRIIKSGKAASMAAAGYKRLTRSIAGVGAMAKTAGAGMASFGKKMLLGVAGIAVPLGLMVKRFATFDDAMRAVAARSGAVGKDLAMLTDRAKELGRTTSFTAVQAANMMDVLAKVGFNPEKIIAASDSILALSRATGTDLALAAEIAAATMSQFKLEATDMEMISDVLTQTVNNSAQGLEDYAEAMKMVAPTARIAGENVIDTSAAIGVLANNAIKGTMAGSALARAYKNLAKEAKQNVLKKWGVEAVDAEGNFRKMATILTELGNKTKQLGSAERIGIFEELFGRGQVSAQLLGGDKAVFTDLQDKLKESAGVAKKTATQMDAGIGGALRRMLSALEGVVIKLGSMFVPMVEKAAKVITDFGGAFVTWLQKNPQVIQSFVGIIKKVALFGATLVAGGVALTTFGKGLGGLAFVLGGVGQAFGGLAQMTSGFFASFSLLIGGLFVWNLDFKKFASNVTETFSGMFKAISTIWGAGFEKMAGAFKRGDFESGMKELGSLLKATAQTILNTITNLVDDAMTEITKSFKKTAAMFAKPINIVVRTVQSLVTPGRIGESGDLGEQIGNYEDAELASRKKDKEIKVLQDKYGTNALSGAYKSKEEETALKAADAKKTAKEKELLERRKRNERVILNLRYSGALKEVNAEYDLKARLEKKLAQKSQVEKNLKEALESQEITGLTDMEIPKLQKQFEEIKKKIEDLDSEYADTKKEKNAPDLEKILNSKLAQKSQIEEELKNALESQEITGLTDMEIPKLQKQFEEIKKKIEDLDSEYADTKKEKNAPDLEKILNSKLAQKSQIEEELKNALESQEITGLSDIEIPKLQRELAGVYNEIDEIRAKTRTPDKGWFGGEQKPDENLFDWISAKLPDSIQESIDKVKKGTAAMVAEQKKQKSSKGVFSAFAAASLKGSSIEVQQLDVQKQMKKGIDSLNEKDNAFQLG